MKKINRIILISLSIIICSCGRLVDFTMISSKNVEINVKKDAPRVSGKGWSVKDALDDAIEKAGPGFDALMDGVIYEGLFKYRVTGTPIKTTDTKK